MIKRAMKNGVERFPKVAQFYRNTRDLFDRNKPSITTPLGFKLAGRPGMAAGTFEPAETQLVRELLQQVDILVNVGANVGYYYYCCHALSMRKGVHSENFWGGGRIPRRRLGRDSGVLRHPGSRTDGRLDPWQCA